jgi:ketosteroid isomerase-like protein
MANWHAMTPNEDLIHHFYTSFQLKDYRGMQGCYADQATFSDSVFINLNANQARAMWQMLISRAKDLVLEFKVVSSNGNQVRAEWIAHYTFGPTKRKVRNYIKAEFEVVDGKIVRHIDHFNFHTWTRQALGPMGLLLGWTPYLQNKVRKTAMKGLNDFMAK